MSTTTPTRSWHVSRASSAGHRRDHSTRVPQSPALLTAGREADTRLKTNPEALMQIQKPKAKLDDPQHAPSHLEPLKRFAIMLHLSDHLSTLTPSLICIVGLAVTA